MIFMGTGAAQLTPAACCECEYCEKIRHSDDKRNIRGRSGFQIDAKNVIDLGPDTNYTAALYGISYRKTENIFFTHTHPDHFSFSNCENLRRGLEPVTLNMWFSESAMDGLKTYFDFALQNPFWGIEKDLKYFREHVTVHSVKDYETFTAGGMAVSALPANHPGMFQGEHGVNYLFERDGKRFLYACDTGLYCEENFAFLKDKPLDVLILECTFGTYPLPREARHMNLEHMEEMIDRFAKAGAFTGDTRLYANHISHQAGLLHEELEERLKTLFGPNASVGYDGLEIAPF